MTHDYIHCDKPMEKCADCQAHEKQEALLRHVRTAKFVNGGKAKVIAAMAKELKEPK